MMKTGLQRQRSEHGGGESAGPAPGKQTRVGGAAPRDWPGLLATLQVPVARSAATRHGAEAAGATPTVAKTMAATPATPAMHDGAGAGEAAALGPCLDPEEIRSQLQQISEECGRIGGELAAAALDVAAPLERHPAALRELSRQAEALRPFVAQCAPGDAGADLRALLTAVQDQLLGCYQQLTVLHADRALQAWSDPDNAGERGRWRDRWRKEASLGVGGGDDWCGAFSAAQLRAAGMAPEHHMSFNHTSNVEGFFTYRDSQGNQRVMTTIVARDDAARRERELAEYHGERRARRDWKLGSEVGDDLRPGDIITVAWEVGGAARHIAIVASYTPASGDTGAVLVTIDGNAFGVKKPGAAMPAFDGENAAEMTAYSDSATGANERDVSISRWETQPGATESATESSTEGATTEEGEGPQFDRSEMLPDGRGYQSFAIYGRGRPSLVDFELGHEFPDRRTDIALPKAAGVEGGEKEGGGGGGGEGGEGGEGGTGKAKTSATALSMSKTPATTETMATTSSAGGTDAPALAGETGGAPAPLFPPGADGSSRGSRIDWESTKGIIGAATQLPENRGSPGSVRELYEFYLLRYLWRELPSELTAFSMTHAIPEESVTSIDGRADRRAAVEALCGFLAQTQRDLLESGQVDAAEGLRRAMFRASEHALADALQVETAHRYTAEDGDTWCNVWAFDLVTAMGGYLPRIWYTNERDEFLVHGEAYAENRHRQVRANDLYDWMMEWGVVEYGWAAVGGVEAGQQAANAGQLVIILGRTVEDDPGKAGHVGPGHVSVVMAESQAIGRTRPTESQTGGAFVPLQSQAGADNFASNDASAAADTVGPTGRRAWWNDEVFQADATKTDAQGRTANHGCFVYRGGGHGEHAVRPPEETGLVMSS